MKLIIFLIILEIKRETISQLDQARSFYNIQKLKQNKLINNQWKNIMQYINNKNKIKIEFL